MLIFFIYSGLAATLCPISHIFNLQHIFTLSFLVCSVRCLHRPQMPCFPVLQSGSTLFYSIMCDGANQFVAATCRFNDSIVICITSAMLRISKFSLQWLAWCIVTSWKTFQELSVIASHHIEERNGKLANFIFDFEILTVFHTLDNDRPA